jgi:hypothetical protein
MAKYLPKRNPPSLTPNLSEEVKTRPKQSIVIFLPVDAAKSVLSKQGSTFCLKNILYYNGLEENCSLVGDNQESRVYFKADKHSYQSLGTSLLSCWTLLNGNKFLDSDWTIFKRRNGVAIVSAVWKVAAVLEEQVEILIGNHWRLEHRPVTYYNESHQPKGFDIADSHFWKREIYSVQREYRFALQADTLRNNLQTIIFYVHDPSEYIERIYFGSELNILDRRELMSGMAALNLGNKLQNFDEEVQKTK